MDRAVICFTRAPVPGQTKTRLMPLLSGEACAELHAAFLRDVARACRETGAAVYVAYTPEGGRGPLADIFPFARGLFPQEGADLGQRMAAAMDRVLALGHSPCVLIGSDLPLLTAAPLNGAFAALEGADALSARSRGTYRYFVSDRQEDFSHLASIFLGWDVTEAVGQVDISQY